MKLVAGHFFTPGTRHIVIEPPDANQMSQALVW
jgi:hypothetical protein